MAFLDNIVINEPVSDITALQAINITSTNDGVIVNVRSNGIFSFESASGATVDNISVVKPTSTPIGTERWLRVDSSFSVGDMRPTISTYVPDGWLLLDDKTIGNTTSAADYRDTAYNALFLHLWNTLINAYAPVSGGRGVSAAADWAANKSIRLPYTVGRVLANSANGIGTYALGQYVDPAGADMTINIGYVNAQFFPGYDIQQLVTSYNLSAFDGTTTYSSVSTAPGFQPTVFVNWMIKF